MKEIRDVFGETLVELAKTDKRIVCLDADLNTSTKTDLFKEAYPSRFIQMGIAEQNMFSFAAGLAASGLIPFPTTFAVFATKRACDQVSISIAYPRLNVKIPGCYCGISTGKSGATHQSVEDLAIMRSMPNMRVLDPADSEELRQMMRAMVDYDGPVYFRVLRPAVPDVFGKEYVFDWKPVLLKNGSDIAIVSTGYMTHVSLKAACLLEDQGISSSVIHVPCLKPLDMELIAVEASKCKAVVTVENHSVIGGLGGAVSELLSEICPVMIHRVGVQDMFVETGEDDDIYRKYGLTVDDIIKTVKRVLERRIKNNLE